MNIVKDILSPACIWPTIAGRDLLDGTRVKQSALCLNCKHGWVCGGYQAGPSPLVVRWHTCPVGWSVGVIRLTSEQEPLRLIGIVDRLSNTSDLFRQKQDESRVVEGKDLDAWIELVKHLERQWHACVREESSRLMGGLHELTTLIAVLGRAVERLRERLRRSEVLSLADLDQVSRCSRHLTHFQELVDIINNPDAGSRTPMRPTSIKAVIEEIVDLFRQRAAERRVSISFEDSSDASPSLYKCFVLVPFALIDNAVKYGEPGSTILIRSYLTPGNNVGVSVSSLGRILNEKDRRQIFDRGFRGSNVSSTGPAQGTGLGLFVAKEVAALHGFVINYEATTQPDLESAMLGYNVFKFDIHANLSAEFRRDPSAK